MTTDSTLPCSDLVHELGVGDLLARRRWATGWAAARASGDDAQQHPHRPARPAAGPAQAVAAATATRRRRALVAGRALLAAAAARRGRGRRRRQVAHGSMLGDGRRARNGARPTSARPADRTRASDPPRVQDDLRTVRRHVRDAPPVLPAGCAERAVGHADLRVRPVPGLARRPHPERDPHAYDLCRRHAARLSVPLGWHLADRRDGDRPRRLTAPAPARPAARSGSRPRRADPARRAGADRYGSAVRAVRVELTRTPLRHAGRPVDVPRGRRHVGRRVRRRPARLGASSSAASGAEDTRRRRHPDPVRRRRGDVDRLPRRDVGGLAAVRAAATSSTTTRVRFRPSTSSGSRSACSPSSCSCRSSTCRCAASGPTRSPTTGCPRTPRSSSTGRAAATMRAARADGLRRRADRRGARLPRAAAGLVRRPLRPRRWPGWPRRRGSRSSTSVPSSTRGCSRSASSPAPACWSPAASACRSPPTSRST